MKMRSGDPRDVLRAAAAASGASLAGLSKVIGRNPAYLQQFVGRGSPRVLPERERRALAAYLGIEETTLGGGSETVERATRLPRLDVSASAGAGSLAEDDLTLGTTAFDPAELRRLGVRPGEGSTLRAQGRSMEPTLLDGDLLLVDRGRRRIGRGGVFVLRHEGALLVKRLAREGQNVAILSDNPDFPPIIVPAEAIDVIGQVVWLSRAL